VFAGSANASPGGPDGRRRGLIAAVGVGWGEAKQSLSASTGADSSISSSAVALHLKIGRGMSERVWVYYNGRGLIHTVPGKETLGSGYLRVTPDDIVFQSINGVPSISRRGFEPEGRRVFVGGARRGAPRHSGVRVARKRHPPTGARSW